MSDNFNETASPSPRKSLVPGVKEERSQLSDKSLINWRQSITHGGLY